MASIIVTGAVPDPSVLATSPLFARPDALVKADPATARAVRIVPATRGAPLIQASLGDWKDTDLVEIELDHGIRVWMSVAALNASHRFNLDSREGRIEVGASMRGLPAAGLIGGVGRPDKPREREKQDGESVDA